MIKQLHSTSAPLAWESFESAGLRLSAFKSVAFALALLLGGHAAIAAQEVVVFSAKPSQANAAIVSYNATLTGGYDLSGINWGGLASQIDPATWGEELFVDISWDGGPETATFALGALDDTYAPNKAFAGTTRLFDSITDPAGTWTFDFYEGLDNGADGLADATWNNISLKFSDTSLDSITNNLGIAGNAGDLITIDTFRSHAIFDTEIALYDASGALLAENDDAGVGFRSEISMNLAAGTYYVAAGHWDTIFDWGFTVSTVPEDIDLNLRMDVTSASQNLQFDTLYSGLGGEPTWVSFQVVPEPATLALLAAGGLTLLGRRRAR